LRLADPVGFVSGPWSPEAAKVKLVVVAAAGGGRLLTNVIANRVRAASAASVSFIQYDSRIKRVSRI